jgi:hypothetical protein
MKRPFSSFQLALTLVLACVAFRLLSSLFPEVVPNLSPLLALAYIGAMCLPRRWGWLIGPAAFVITDLALLPTNYRVNASVLSWWTLTSLAFYFAAAGLGILISQRKSLARVLSGSVLLSVGFYVVANTFSWAGTPAYPRGFAGWWQANTVGLPGYAPSWTFLRNGIAGDLFFVAVFLLVLDRALLLCRAPARPVVHPPIPL